MIKFILFFVVKQQNKFFQKYPHIYYKKEINNKSLKNKIKWHQQTEFL